MEERPNLRPKYRAKMVVAVGGPPHSGKSVLLAELYRQLLAKAPRKNFAFLQRMSPDGEGVWSAESRPEVVKEIRRKGKFAPGFLDRHLPLLMGPALVGSFEILLADLGGIRSAENAEILRCCTHVIILSSKDEENEPWSQFAAAEGCQTLAILASRLVKREDGTLDHSVRSSLDLSSEPVRGILSNLDREGPADPYREAISQFADWLIARVERR